MLVYSLQQAVQPDYWSVEEELAEDCEQILLWSESEGIRHWLSLVMEDQW